MERVNSALSTPTGKDYVRREVLEALLSHYVSLVNSGDAGNWNPETEPEVIAARAELKRTKEA